MSPTARKAILAVKAVVSVGLIGFLLASMDWTKLFDHLDGLNWLPLGFAFAVFVAQFPISAYKWQRSLRVHELDYPFPFLLKVLSIGFFFNNFLPTSIGGDGYRVLRTLPATGSKSRALSAVALERVLGVAALLCLGFVGAIVIVLRNPSTLVIYFVTFMAIGFVALAVLVVLWRLGYLKNLWERLLRMQKLRVLTENAGLIARSRGPLASVVIWSFVFQVLAVLGVAALFEALGHPVSLAICAVVGTMSAVVAVLPVSINGIGVSEGSFVAAAVSLGVNVEYAVVVALMCRALVVPLSVGCGLIYLWELRVSGNGTVPKAEDDGAPTFDRSPLSEADESTSRD